MGGGSGLARQLWCDGMDRFAELASMAAIETEIVRLRGYPLASWDEAVLAAYDALPLELTAAAPERRHPFTVIAGGWVQT